MCTRSLEECGCECHEAGSTVSHVTACCVTCQWCKARLQHLYAEAHVSACRATRKETVSVTARRHGADPEEAWEAYCERFGFDPH